MTAIDLMTANPVTATPQASIAEIWDLMGERDIRHVPIVEDGALVGIVSDRDLGHLDMTSLLAVEGAQALREALEAPIVNTMSADVISIEPDTDVSEIVDLLIEHKVGALPVVLPGTDTIIGIVSYVDVLRALRERLPRP
ncbi:MAG TPA: CBS domain-containing protein [Candidatus Methylomirabilis sp.]|nr:CBS domain-containing protein [Candidatus Methylomirabilis sp.]